MEIINMSKKELERIKILSKIQEGLMSQVQAGMILNITDRQVRNLLIRMETSGNEGVASKKRGKKSNNKLSDDLRIKVLSLIRELYSDFGPTLINEYLKTNHEINISTESLRNWMIEAHIWIPRTRKKTSHLPRPRKLFFGQMIQIDGSHHRWFESRGPSCVLMVFIDDATSLVTSLYFAETETLEAYYKTFEQHLKKYGIPLSLYGDRCSVLTPRTLQSNEDCTQFQKAAKELSCEIILAKSPQAKGRVERVNRTLQDRLVKFLRIKSIDNIKDANKVLDEYLIEHNKKFSKKPSEQIDVHRSLDGICLEQILCIRRNRTLSKELIVQFNNTFYLIQGQENLFKGGIVEIRTYLNGKQGAFFKGKEVTMTPLSEVYSPVLNEKEVQVWKDKKIYIPPKNHPFKKGFKNRTAH